MYETVVHSNSTRSSRAPSHADGYKNRTASESTLTGAPGGDALMDSIFAAVTLPDVEYTKHPERPARVEMNLSAALAQMDDELAREESESYRSSQSGIMSPAASSVAQQIVDQSFMEHIEYHHDHIEHEQPLGRGVSNTSLHSITSASSQRTFVDVHSQHSHSAEERAELDDAFDEPAHLPYTHIKTEEELFRKRSQTLDSQVSTAESRFGGFDVHDENGEFLAQELDLHHNEVAYKRLSKKKGSPHPNKFVSQTVDEQRRELEETQRRLVKERQQIASLQEKIKQSSVNGNGHSEEDGATHKYKNEKNEIIEEDVGVSKTARQVLHAGTEVGEIGGKTLVVPQMREAGKFAGQRNVRKVIIGGDQRASPEDKTVLLFGPPGSGKTSLLNSILNYVYDVKRENGFRFVISDKITASKGLTAYVLNNSILPFSVTIVDTPGIPNVQGDKTVSTMIQAWFEQELLAAGQFRLDAISIVLRHDEKRLDWPFINELALVKRMFGDDLKTNVLPIITHSEVLPQPIAVRSLAQANISFLEYYKLNNSGFFPEALPEMSKLKHKLFYQHGIVSLERYFKGLEELIHPLLAVIRSPSRRLTTDSDQAAMY